MKRWMMVVSILLLVGLLAACGGGDQDASDTAPDATNEASVPATPTQRRGTPLPTVTLRPAAPRSLPVPEGDPQQFEVPFSTGPFLRESLKGNPVSPQTGGQRGSYMHPGGGHVQITVYRFQSPNEAQRTVEFTLNGSGIDAVLGEPYYAPAVSFGLAQDQRGDYLAVWSNDEWVFIARTSGERALLDEFLAQFPY